MRTKLALLALTSLLAACDSTDGDSPVKPENEIGGSVGGKPLSVSTSTAFWNGTSVNVMLQTNVGAFSFAMNPLTNGEYVLACDDDGAQAPCPVEVGISLATGMPPDSLWAPMPGTGTATITNFNATTGAFTVRVEGTLTLTSAGGRPITGLAPTRSIALSASITPTKVPGDVDPGEGPGEEPGEEPGGNPGGTRVYGTLTIGGKTVDLLDWNGMYGDTSAMFLFGTSGADGDTNFIIRLSAKPAVGTQPINGIQGSVGEDLLWPMSIASPGSVTFTSVKTFSYGGTPAGMVVSGSMSGAVPLFRSLADTVRFTATFTNDTLVYVPATPPQQPLAKMQAIRGGEFRAR